MRILLLNAPHPAIGSRIPREHLPPLGLLAVGGGLLDGGHEVRLLDAELGPLSMAEIARETLAYAPEVLMVGHSGSTSGHPVIAEICRALRRALPQLRVVYGGVYPTFHYREVLRDCPEIDVIVRGEGEVTASRVADAIAAGRPLGEVEGIAFRDGATVVATAEAPPIEDLDAHRVGWELVDPSRYSYWGGRRAVVAQFSRGCPHGCTYCGQRLFWKRFRHRDPKRFAAELARLHRVHGVEVVNLADENPTSRRGPWLELLRALAAEDVPLLIVGSARAGDVVRDADVLHLYRRAGVVRLLMGTESTDEATLRSIRKGATTATDREAIRLLRRHGILSLVTFAVGFGEDTDRDMLRLLRQLLSYDPDQIQSVFATPHRWTPFFRVAAERRVVQQDLRLWDYKHQVIASGRMPPWRVLAWTKLIEATLQLRPRSLARTFLHPDAEVRHGMRWYTEIGRRVWPHEILGFLLRERRVADGPSVEAFLQGRGELRSASRDRGRRPAALGDSSGFWRTAGPPSPRGAAPRGASPSRAVRSSARAS